MADAPHLLFAISNDFGELANALYFLSGQPLRANLLMPKRMLDLQGQSLPHAAAAYASANDIISAIRSQRPDAVLLFSGYLFGVNSLFDPPALTRIVAEAGQVGARVASTDPFLGLLSRPVSPFHPGHPLAGRFTAHFGQVSLALRDVHHLYLCDPENLTSSLSSGFFNPNIITSRDEVAATLGRYGYSSDGPPRWLFTLSGEDYAMQCNRFGADQFHQIALGLFNQTTAHGRRPMFISPQPLIGALQSLTRSPQDLNSANITAHAHDLFRALIIDAEHVFYWNIFSNSILARVANRGPVFFFHEGHLPNAMPPVRQLGMERYYRGAPLPFLDAQRPLTLSTLSASAAAQPALFAPALASFRHLATPAEVIRSLLGSPVP